MLKSLVDEDEFCKKLRMSRDEDSKPDFYTYFYNLLMDPSVTALEDILSNYAMQDIINGIKYLIKFKLDRLCDEIVANILKIVEMMLDYERGLDTLIVNLLRRNMVEEVYHMYKTKAKYFDDHTNGFMFLCFFCAQDWKPQRIPEKFGFYSRDFLFSRMRDMWNEFYLSKTLKKRAKRMFEHSWEDGLVLRSPFDISEKPFFPALKVPTPLNILSSKLSVELEMNITFILETESNFGFYMYILFNNYIRDDNDACWILRFLVNIPGRVCISRMVNSILRRYPLCFVAVIYDLLFWNGSEQLNMNLVEYIREERNEFINDLINLQEEWSLLKETLGRILHDQSMEDVIKIIHSMNFNKYYKAIKEMGKKGTPIIPRKMYNDIITDSFGWDGYAQVYLWKILAFQRIHLGFEVNKPTSGSFEAQEGFEIIKNLFTSDENKSAVQTHLLSS